MMRKPAAARKNARRSQCKSVAPAHDAVVRNQPDGGAGHAQVGAGWWSDDPPEAPRNTAHQRD
jgi:hypothetical protein